MDSVVQGFTAKKSWQHFFLVYVVFTHLDFINRFLTVRGKGHLSLEFALLCLQLVLHLLGALRCRLVTQHLTFESGHLHAKQTCAMCDMHFCWDLFMPLCNYSFAYVLFQRSDLLLRLHQFELQVTDLPV